jgi:TPR repeat protein
MDLPLATRNVNRLALIFLFATAAPECVVAGQLEDGLAALDKLDFTTAVKLLEPLAEQGNVEAQVRLGVICRNGLGMPVDFTHAVKWYRLAADQDNPQAQFDLGEGEHCCEPDGEVRSYRLLFAAQIVLCRPCWEQENRHRQARGEELGCPKHWSTRDWDQAERHT